MRVLFVGLKIGAGIESICNSIKAECDKKQGIETAYVDIYAENQKMAQFSKDSYYKLVKYIPRLTALGQRMSLWLALKTRNNHLFINKDVKCCKAEIMKYIERFKPDVIYTPLCMVAMALDELIEESKIQLKYIFQIPDFLIPYYAQNLKHCSYVISSCDKVTESLLKLKFDDAKILTYGIPLNPKFKNLKEQRENILQKLGYEDKKYILISNGGAGFANNYKIVTDFYDKVGEYSFIVVNGRNLESKEKIDNFIKEKNISNVINLGFVDNMHELMKISEIMIGKCGSSTINEASLSGLKFIGLNNFLVPEIYNIKYLKSKDAIIVVKNGKQIEKALKIFINDQKENIHKNFTKICNPKSCEQIADVVCSLCDK